LCKHLFIEKTGVVPHPSKLAVSCNLDAREQILQAAYELFSHRGIRAVGIEAILTRSGVARMTLYRHFGSKEELVLAFLEQRDQQWTQDWLQAEVKMRASDAKGRLLAIFDAFDGWFHTDEFEGCAFINVMLEAEPGSRFREESIHYLERIRSFVEGLAAEAGIPDAAGFSRKWHILMKGSIVSAGEGDRDAAQRARDMAVTILDQALALPLTQ
jgi:AcrR family transcriptional regulator